MKAKVISTGEIIEVKEWRGASDVIYSTPDMNMFYATDDLELLPEESPESAKIEGWAIRWQDGDLTLFQQQPIRLISKDEYPDGWTSRDGCRFFLPTEKLPFVTYENSPKRVKITITPIEDECKA